MTGNAIVYNHIDLYHGRLCSYFTGNADYSDARSESACEGKTTP